MLQDATFFGWFDILDGHQRQRSSWDDHEGFFQRLHGWVMDDENYGPILYLRKANGFSLYFSAQIPEPKNAMMTRVCLKDFFRNFSNGMGEIWVKNLVAMFFSQGSSN